MLSFTLEDGHRREKIPGETRIPPGVYEVRFRTTGGHHEKYLGRYKDRHFGMLHLQRVPNFEHVLIHIGNEAKDTAGCLLVGMSADRVGEDWEITESRVAYEQVYARFSQVMRGNGGRCVLSVRNSYD